MYKTAWDKLLKQMTPISQLSEKTLVKIFKDGIPDAYFKTCFDQQNHRTWMIGYEWCKDQLKDHNFLTGYTRHADKSLAIAEAKHQSEIETLKREVMQLKQSKQSTSTPIVTPPVHLDNSKKDSKKKSEQPADASKPWEVQGNVNPKWDPSNPRNDNPQNIPCEICSPGVHKYGSQYCTSSKIKGTKTDTPRLSQLELQTRKFARQELGHYCTSMTLAPKLSSIEDHHETAAKHVKIITADVKRTNPKP
jgi:hypothetical protein